MSDDWDSEVPEKSEPLNVVDPWADEDAEEPVVDDWDADPAAAPTKLAPPTKPKALSKQKQKKKDEEEKREADRLARDEENDPTARSRRKMQEEEAAKERDAILAADLMGGSLGSGSAIGYGIADDVPRSGVSEEAECEKVVSMLVKKMAEFPSNAKNSARFLKFFKTLVCGPAGDVLRLEEMTELKRLVTVKHTEMTAKQKNQKKKGGAATSSAKPAVKLGMAGKGGKSGPYQDDFGGDYDDEDDGGFM